MSGDEARLNAELIDEVARNMEAAGDSLPDHVAAALRAVPRHLFVPDVPVEEAYVDQAIVIKDERGEPRSSSSQPTVMAVMLRQLDLRPGHRALEIGTGTGYNAALMAHIVGARGRVVTVDLDEELADAARERLATVELRSVEVHAGDGARGWPEAAPYDRIVVTAAAWDVPAAWRAQLADDGVIVMPLIVHAWQACVALRPAGDHLETHSIRPGGFMPLRGVSGRHASPLRLGPREGLFVEFLAQDEPPVAAEAMYAWLTGPWVEEETGVSVDSLQQLFQALGWLALRDPAYVRLTAHGDEAEHELLPPLPQPLTSRRLSSAAGLADDAGLAFVALPEPHFGGDPSLLFVRRYGHAEAAAQRLVEHLQAWAAAGKPPAVPRRVRVFPRAAALPPGGDVLVRRESVLVVE